MTDSDSRQRCCDHYHRERYPHLEKRKFGGEEADAVIVGLGAAGLSTSPVCSTASMKATSGCAP